MNQSLILLDAARAILRKMNTPPENMAHMPQALEDLMDAAEATKLSTIIDMAVVMSLAVTSSNNEVFELLKETIEQCLLLLTLDMVMSLTGGKMKPKDSSRSKEVDTILNDIMRLVGGHA